uniref:Large ribosomal subunit protein uL11 C-terminal domain-containing protein n=1 Tax=Solanum lycopersicum TaxID=4081 RepID=K4BS15_SOLLC
MSIMEMSHCGKEFFSIIQKEESDLRTLLNISDKYTVLFLQGESILVIKALKEPKRERKKMKNIKHNGNISPDVVIEIAKVMQPRSMANDFS